MYITEIIEFHLKFNKLTKMHHIANLFNIKGPQYVVWLDGYTFVSSMNNHGVLRATICMLNLSMISLKFYFVHKLHVV